MRILIRLMLLAMITSALAGCLFPRTPTTGLTAAMVRSDICLRWLEQSYDSEQDSAATVDEIREKNATRNGFCNK